MPARPRLIHVLPNLEVSGCYNLLVTLMSELKSAYAHTVLIESDLTQIDYSLVMNIQACGGDVIAVAAITPETIGSIDASGVILYNVTGHAGIGKVYPTIYYSYGVYDSDPGESAVVSCSCYARNWRRCGDQAEIGGTVIPPMIQSRGLRQLRSQKTKFRVGLITSGAYDKYPCGSAIRLLGGLPDDMELLITTLPKYRHPGVLLALEARKDRRAVRLCPVKPMAGIRYMLACDVIICCSAGNHGEPFGRGAVEAMAMRKPVVCENRGNYPNIIEHGVNGLLYDKVEQAIEYVEQLKGNTEMARKLGINAQMSAGWYDTSVHIGDLKQLLRKLGV